jgi:hypothetical protein
LIPSPYQNRVLSVPEEYNVALLGGRGGGKTVALMLLILRSCEMYKEKAKVLVIRESYKSLQDFELKFYGLLCDAYGHQNVRYNRADHIMSTPDGAQIEFGQLEKPTDVRKYHGREFTLLVIEEMGLLRDAQWVELLKAGMRGDGTVPLRVCASANPGGALHQLLQQRYITGKTPWAPYTVGTETWVTAPSTYLDNPFIRQDDYLNRLRASTADPELLKAWENGDWNIAKGQYFPMLDQSVHMLKNIQPLEINRKKWAPFISFDYGQAAPAVCYLCLRAPGDDGPYIKDSLLLVDELAIVDPMNVNKGLNWPPSKIADAIIEMCDLWGVPAEGVGDDAAGLTDSLLTTLRQHKVYLRRPKKERVAGWRLMQNMLEAAKTRSGPGLFISERCKYFWQTVPFLQRDEVRPEDMDTRGPDHAADCVRYAAMQANRAKGGYVPITSGTW